MHFKVIKQYFPKNHIIDLTQFGNGHINDTFKVVVQGMPKDYILQKINTQVFLNPDGIIKNHIKLKKVFNSHHNDIEIAEIVPNSSGGFLTMDEDGGAWRLTAFIDDSYSIEVIEKNWQALEAGRAFGRFAEICSQLNVLEFSESIKDFHKLSFRIGQLNDAIKNNKANRLSSVQVIVDFYKNREAKLSDIEALINSGKIPLRVVHNDTKINNLLFKEQKAIAVIDLDTVGPGILYYDYGDALRTSANTAVEDEKDLTKVDFNIEAFASFTKGYMSKVKGIINESEEAYFYLAPVLMTYIMGIRFLADYLNGDTYYKVAYPEHNIVRAKVQKKLIESMENNEQKMKEVIKESLKATNAN